MLNAYGDDDQKTEFLAPLNRGDDIGAFALSEAGAGSDVPAMGTTAEKDGDEYVVNGDKLWISNGSVADTVTLFAKTDPDAGHRGISSFVVRPKQDDGFHVEGTEDKLGDKGCPTAELRFDDMRIPESRILGEEGEGFTHALETLNGGRITIAARSIGLAAAALEDSLQYAQDREQFDQPISEFQTIQHKLADMDTKIQSAKLLMHRAADKKIRGEDFIRTQHRRSSTPPRSAARSPTRASRSTAATATRRTSTSNATTATRSSTRSTRGPARCSATPSLGGCWSSAGGRCYSESR